MGTTAITVNLSLIALAESETTKGLSAPAYSPRAPTMRSGMRYFKHMPELDWHWGYPVALGVMVAIDIYRSPALGRRAGFEKYRPAARKPCRRRSRHVSE